MKPEVGQTFYKFVALLVELTFAVLILNLYLFRFLYRNFLISVQNDSIKLADFFSFLVFNANSTNTTLSPVYRMLLLLQITIVVLMQFHLQKRETDCGWLKLKSPLR